MRRGKYPVFERSNKKRNNSIRNGHRDPKYGPEVHLNGPHKRM